MTNVQMRLFLLFVNAQTFAMRLLCVCVCSHDEDNENSVHLSAPLGNNDDVRINSLRLISQDINVSLPLMWPQGRNFVPGALSACAIGEVSSTAGTSKILISHSDNT